MRAFPDDDSLRQFRDWVNLPPAALMGPSGQAAEGDQSCSPAIAGWSPWLMLHHATELVQSLAAQPLLPRWEWKNQSLGHMLGKHPFFRTSSRLADVRCQTNITVEHGGQCGSKGRGCKAQESAKPAA